MKIEDLGWRYEKSRWKYRFHVLNLLKHIAKRVTYHTLLMQYEAYGTEMSLMTAEKKYSTFRSNLICAFEFSIEYNEVRGHWTSWFSIDAINSNIHNKAQRITNFETSKEHSIYSLLVVWLTVYAVHFKPLVCFNSKYIGFDWLKHIWMAQNESYNFQTGSQSRTEFGICTTGCTK